MRITWDEADGIKQRGIDRGLARRKEIPDQYVTIVSGVEGGKARVLAIEDDRDENSLNRFWRTLTAERRETVEAVSMDMWETYWNTTLRYVPGASEKIVYDNFHLARYMNWAVDEVRLMEHLMEGEGIERVAS
jgi:transposase